MQKSKPSKTSAWLQSLLGPAVVGLIVLCGQGFIAPKIARDVKIEESVLEQRYMACEDAFTTLFRKLERSPIVKGEVKYKPKPTKEKVTAIEFNTTHFRLALFCSSSAVPEKFAQLMGAKSVKISDIGEFVYMLRKEMGIEGEGVAPEDFHFAYYSKEAVPK